MRVHYPLRSDDVMKLIDKAWDRAVDKAVTMAAPVQSLASAIHACGVGLEALAQQVAILAQNQAIQHHALQQMHQLQHYLMNKLGEHSMDMSMPDIDAPKQPKPEDEAAIKRARAASKPN